MVTTSYFHKRFSQYDVQMLNFKVKVSFINLPTVKVVFNVGKTWIIGRNVRCIVVLSNARGYISYPHSRRNIGDRQHGLVVYTYRRYDSSATEDGRTAGRVGRLWRSRALVDTSRAEHKPNCSDWAIHKAAAAEEENAEPCGASAPSITAVWRLSSKQPGGLL